MSKQQMRDAYSSMAASKPVRGVRRTALLICAASAVLAAPIGLKLMRHRPQQVAASQAVVAKHATSLGQAAAVELLPVPSVSESESAPVIQVAENILPVVPVTTEVVAPTTATVVEDAPICLTGGETSQTPTEPAITQANMQTTSAPLLPDDVDIDPELAPPGSLTPPPMPEPRELAFQQKDEQEKPLNPRKPTLLWEQLTTNPRGFRNLDPKQLNVTKPRYGLEASSELVWPNDEKVIALRDPKIKSRLGQQPVENHVWGFKRGWNPQCFTWLPSGYHHGPVYFEDEQLERYGNEWPIIQPLLSGGAFFAQIPTMPYQMNIEGNGPCAWIYDLGLDRPGDCVPYSLQRLPFSWTGAIAEGTVATGLVFIIP